jgi:hypothetical protein
MANVTDQHPWILDTAAAITTDDLFISKLRWVGGTTADHSLIVHDKNANVVWEAAAQGANEDIELDFSGECLSACLIHGLTLNTIESGKLLVYLK